jgi:hypothetical protein
MTLLKWLIAVAAMFGGFVALMYVAQRALMYHPEALRTPPAAAGLFDDRMVRAAAALPVACAVFSR